MFTIKFGELPGSGMYTMKQHSGAALYVHGWSERGSLCAHMILILGTFDMGKMRYRLRNNTLSAIGGHCQVSSFIKLEET